MTIHVSDSNAALLSPAVIEQLNLRATWKQERNADGGTRDQNRAAQP